MSPEITLAIAAIHASLHGIRMAANAGIVSPADIEQSLDGIAETLEHLPTDMQAIMQMKLDPQFVGIRRAAEENWKP